MKPMLIGESNPYGSDPAYALYPHPEGSSGHRLATEILRMLVGDYLAAFRRCNLSVGAWCLPEARIAAAAASGDRLILLGRRVCDAFELEYTPFRIHEQFGSGPRRLLVLPHPSGLCRTWNDPMAAATARLVVASLVPEVSEMLGRATE